MNKTFITTLVAFCVSLLLTSFLVITTPERNYKSDKNRSDNNKRHSDADDDAVGDFQWNIKRLADPATGNIPAGIRRAELAFAAQMPKPKLLRGADYVNRGPYNVGGRTRSFAIDVNDSNIYIAASVSGSIYRSANSGQTWSKTLDAVYDQGFSCLAQDTRVGHTNVWYAATGEGFGQSASAGGNAYFLGNGIYKSTDDGVTWDTIASTNVNSPQGLVSAFQIAWNIKTDPSRLDSSIVYAACYGGLYRSNNEGVTWKRVKGSLSGTDAYFTDVSVTATGVVYATFSSDGAANKGIWRSMDGLNLTSITPDSFPTDYNLIAIGISPANDSVAYFLANTVNAGTPDTNFLGTIEWNELWKYTYINDTTSQWENLSANIPYTGGGPFDKLDAQGSYNLVVAVKPDDPNTVLIGGTNIFRSTDGFETNQHITQIGGYKIGTHLPKVLSYTNHHPDQHVFFFDHNNPSVFYDGNDGGLFKTNNVMQQDSVKWITFDNGYLTTQFYAIAIDNATPGDSTIVGGTQDNGSWFVNSLNPQNTWIRPYGGDGSFCYIANHKAVYYLSEDMGKTERAILDNNGNVTSFARIDPQNGKGFQFVNPFVVDPNDETKMYMPVGQYMWRNDNLAGIPMINNYDSITTNWETLPDTCTTAEGEIVSVAISTDSAHILFYGTDKGKVYKVRNANIGSPTRVDISSSSFPTSAFVNCIAIDPLNSNNVIVVFSNYSIYSVWNTINGGQTWNKCAGNLEENSFGTGNGPSCRWASIMHLTDGTLYYMATSTGLYATDTLNGVNTIWVQQSINTIGNDVCDMVLTRPADGLVVVATHGNGIFSANVTSVKDAISGVNNVSNSVVTTAQLFPNPGTDATELLMNTNKHGTYTIQIFDLTGRMISSTVKQLNVGINTIPLNFPANEASGIYLINISNGQETKTLRYMKIE